MEYLKKPSEYKNKKVIIKDDSLSRHGHPIGTEFTVTTTPTSYSSPKDHTPFTLAILTRNGTIINKIQACLGEFTLKKEGKEAIEEQIADCQKILEELQNKLDYMVQNDLKDFNEIDYTIHKTLTSIEEGTMTRHQRAELIKKVITGTVR